MVRRNDEVNERIDTKAKFYVDVLTSATLEPEYLTKQNAMNT